MVVKRRIVIDKDGGKGMRSNRKCILYCMAARNFIVMKIRLQFNTFCNFNCRTFFLGSRLPQKDECCAVSLYSHIL